MAEVKKKQPAPKVKPPPPTVPMYDPAGTSGYIVGSGPTDDSATFGDTAFPGTPEPRPILQRGRAYVDAPFPPDPRSAGTGGGGRGGGSDNSDIDWADVYFGQYGLPADLKNQIIDLGKKYGTSNPGVFFQSAQNLIRASDWFAGVFPGFAAGVRAGLFTDETGYRGYVNQLDQVYRQYLGRAVSGAETSAALGSAATPDLIGRQFQGDTIANVNTNEWQYLAGAFDESGRLTDAEKTALGRQQAGIDTPLGQMASKRVQLAMGRAQALFSGTLATPSLSLVNGRLVAPSLGAGPPDIGA